MSKGEVGSLQSGPLPGHANLGAPWTSVRRCHKSQARGRKPGPQMYATLRRILSLEPRSRHKMELMWTGPTGYSVQRRYCYGNGSARMRLLPRGPFYCLSISYVSLSSALVTSSQAQESLQHRPPSSYYRCVCSNCYLAFVINRVQLMYVTFSHFSYWLAQTSLLNSNIPQ